MKRGPTTTITIRVPKKLKTAAEAVAAREDRTMTGLIVHLLRSYVDKR